MDGHTAGITGFFLQGMYVESAFMGVSVYEQQESKKNVFAAFHCPEIKAINVTNIPQQAHIHTYDIHTHAHIHTPMGSFLNGFPSPEHFAIGFVFPMTWNRLGKKVIKWQLWAPSPVIRLGPRAGPPSA